MLWRRIVRRREIRHNVVTYFIRRALLSIPIIFGVTLLCFLLINLAPGNPVDMMIDPNMSSEAIEARKEALGLNDPIYIQYFKWLTNLLQGNLGYSMSTYQPVSELVLERIWPTVLLIGSSIIFGLIIAIPLGILSATKQYSKWDYLVTGFAFFGVSIPNFFLALGVIYIFALQLKILPTGGMTTLGGTGGALDTAIHLLLPTLVLGTALAGKFVRYVRSSVLEVLGADYLRTARAKGLREFWVINKHGLRNALIPIITIVGLEIPLLLSSTVVIEQIFSWPGIGELMLSSILARDYSTVMAINLLAAIIVVVINFLTDIVYSIVDPRIKYD